MDESICPYCSADISEYDDTCPSCGAVLREKKPEKKKKIELPKEDL